MLAAKEEKLQLRAQRREQQAQNVQRKREQREAHKWVQGGMVLHGCTSEMGWLDPLPYIPSLLQKEEHDGHEAGPGRWGQ